MAERGRNDPATFLKMVTGTVDDDALIGRLIRAGGPLYGCNG
jgi:hypothetical protein